jgi:hypothetical protein
MFLWNVDLLLTEHMAIYPRKGSYSYGTFIIPLSEWKNILLSHSDLTERSKSTPKQKRPIKLQEITSLLHFRFVINEVRLVNILWHVDPLLGNDREISNYTTGNGSNKFITTNNGIIGKWCSLRSPYDSDITQQYKNYSKRCFLCSPCRGYITRSSCDSERILGQQWEE